MESAALNRVQISGELSDWSHSSSPERHKGQKNYAAPIPPLLPSALQPLSLCVSGSQDPLLFPAMFPKTTPPSQSPPLYPVLPHVTSNAKSKEHDGTDG